MVVIWHETERLIQVKVGKLTVSGDGTKLYANASKHSAMSHDRVEKEIKPAQDQIAELLERAGEADSNPAARRPPHS